MNIVFREGTGADADACGPIIFEAFKEISSAHGFPWDFPSAEVGVGVATMLLGHPGFWGVVAESGGKILGSNFLDERNPIAGIGPITVDPAVQNQTIGRQLMVEVIERAAGKGLPACGWCRPPTTTVPYVFIRSSVSRPASRSRK